MVEQLCPDGEAEARGRAGGQKTAGDGQQRACQGAAQHPKTNRRDIRRRRTGRLDELRQLRHIIRQLQVKIDLARHQQQAGQGHQPLLSAHVF